MHISVKISRRAAIGALTLFMAGATIAAGTSGTLAQSSKRHDLNLDKNGVAVHGYDPVAYFTVGKPVKGKSDISARNDGAIYHFSSAANRQAFLKEPEKYKPAYGGFCAIGTSLEKKFDGRPDLWKIVDGRLYLNVAPGPHKRWLSEIPQRIKQANVNWPKIRSEPAAAVNAK